MPLELLPVLSAGEMSELLAAELEGLGFERDGRLMRRAGEDGVELEIDLEAGTVTARLAAARDLDVHATRSQAAVRGREEEAREKARAALADDLDQKVEEGRRALTAEVTATLEAALRDVAAELDRATSRATAEALKIRAAQLGEVTEVSENPETGEIAIRVKV